MPARRSRILSRRVIGCGNPFRGDDGAGLAVAAGIKSANLPDTEAMPCSGEASEILDLLRGAKTVILVDAMKSGRKPGTIACFNPLERELPEAAFVSSHALGVAHAVRLAHALNRLPENLLVYGIEGDNFDHGRGLTPAVRAAVSRLVATLSKESCTKAS